jgi:UDP-glucose 4-epimerase
MDLAYGHVAALDAMQRMPRGTAMTVNLGTGNGVSVLEMVEAFERVNGVPVPRKIVERREGDAAVCYADPSRAKELLGWEAKLGVEEMCRDAWNWQKNNPMGYREA